MADFDFSYAKKSWVNILRWNKVKYDPFQNPWDGQRLTIRSEINLKDFIGGSEIIPLNKYDLSFILS